MIGQARKTAVYTHRSLTHFGSSIGGAVGYWNPEVATMWWDIKSCLLIFFKKATFWCKKGTIIKNILCWRKNRSRVYFLARKPHLLVGLVSPSPLSKNNIKNVPKDLFRVPKTFFIVLFEIQLKNYKNKLQKTLFPCQKPSCWFFFLKSNFKNSTKKFQK
jgi:hypothetical protein